MIKKVYKNLRNNIAHKRINNRERFYGKYSGEPLLHQLVEVNYSGFKNFKKLSRKARRNPRRRDVMRVVTNREPWLRSDHNNRLQEETKQ